LKDLVTGKLSRAERLIVVLYYYEQMSMKEIGVTLDLSESRVSQMHSSIMARLKVQLADRMDDFHSPNE
ncbi:MAG: sigma factor-like helix-turn-helix DNA-binding protein, partial [Planctomycetota bacterium]